MEAYPIVGITAPVTLIKVTSMRIKLTAFFTFNDLSKDGNIHFDMDVL